MPSIVSLHVLDLESLLIIALNAYKNGLLTILYSSRLARFITCAINSRTLHELNIYYTGKKPLPTIDIDFLPLNEALKEMIDHKSIIITEYETIDIARLLLGYTTSKPVATIIASSEPATEEYSIEMKKQLEWFRLTRIQPYRLRVSGHYYPYELVKLLKLLKPRRIIPIHTKYPEFITTLFHNL